MDMFDSFAKGIMYEYTKQIEEECKEALREGVLENIYQSYQPSVYKRTSQFISAVSSKIDGMGNIVVFIDTDKLNYTSAVDGEDTSDKVPFFLESGHHDNKGSGKYHDYDATNFLELANEIILSRFGGQVITEIINNSPY